MTHYPRYGTMAAKRDAVTGDTGSASTSETAGESIFGEIETGIETIVEDGAEAALLVG